MKRRRDIFENYLKEEKSVGISGLFVGRSEAGGGSSESDSRESSLGGKVDGAITSSDWDSDLMTNGPAESRRGLQGAEPGKSCLLFIHLFNKYF